MTTIIEYKGQDITIEKLADIIKGKALSHYGPSEYFFVTIYSEDCEKSADIKFRISDHYPNPNRCDERTCSFATAGAKLHVGSYPIGYVFLDEKCELMNTYESIVEVLEWEIESATNRF